MRTPYSMQYNFTIERQQWNTGLRLSYIGTALREGEYAYDYNSPVPDALPYIAKPRPYPKYPGITYVTNGAGHQYNGLTFEATRQMAKGLYMQTSWTWARDRYDMDYNWTSITPRSPPKIRSTVTGKWGWCRTCRRTASRRTMSTSCRLDAAGIFFRDRRSC